MRTSPRKDWDSRLGGDRARERRCICLFRPHTAVVEAAINTSLPVVLCGLNAVF
jgi:hypothetical protein